MDAAKNTDKIVWKQPTTNFGEEDGNDSGMEPYVFVTEHGGVGMCHYGSCVVKTIEQWVKTSSPTPLTETQKESWEEAFDKWFEEHLPQYTGTYLQGSFYDLVSQALLSERARLVRELEVFQREDASLALEEESDGDDFEYFHGARIGVKYALDKAISIINQPPQGK